MNQKSSVAQTPKSVRWALKSDTLITTAKLNGVEPYTYLKDVLERMVAGHPMNQLDQLLPWHWKPKTIVKH